MYFLEWYWRTKITFTLQSKITEFSQLSVFTMTYYILTHLQVVFFGVLIFCFTLSNHEQYIKHHTGWLLDKTMVVCNK